MGKERSEKPHDWAGEWGPGELLDHSLCGVQAGSGEGKG